MADAERPPFGSGFEEFDAGEPLVERARAVRRPVAPGGVAGRAGVVAGLAGVVAMAAGLMLVVIEPRAPDESAGSEQAREPRSAPSGEPAGSTAGESAVSPAVSPRAPAVEAADAVEPEPATPAAELPAAAPGPDEDLDASDDADAGPDEPAPSPTARDDKRTIENPLDGGNEAAGENEHEQWRAPGSETLAP